MSKQTTLMQSWAKSSSQPRNKPVRPSNAAVGGTIDLMEEDEDEDLLRAMEESLKYHQPGIRGVEGFGGGEEAAEVTGAGTMKDDLPVKNQEPSKGAKNFDFHSKKKGGAPVKNSNHKASSGLFGSIGTRRVEKDNQLEVEAVNFDLDLEEGEADTIPTATAVEDLPGFDRQAGRLWIYPTNYPVRDYQHSIVQEALYKNTLVCLPTGLGKTFIAAVVMYNFYRWYPQGKIVFMAPTKPLVAQQIEACYNIMGIPQAHTAEMTGAMLPADRQRAWNERRVFFLTPQVLTNDLSRAVFPANAVKCLVVDEAHKALGNHAYCQVVRELLRYGSHFRVLALSATPGSDLKAVQQVLTNLAIAHVELRSEESPDIRQYSHERRVEKIVVPLGDHLTAVKNKYLDVLEIVVSRLRRAGALYGARTAGGAASLSKFQVLKAREAFRQNPPNGLPRQQYGAVEGDFALAMSLYHGYELLQLHGLRSLYTFLDGVLKGNPRNRTELMKNAQFSELFSSLSDQYQPTKVADPNAPISCTPMRASQAAVQTTIGHPKLDKLQEIVVSHFGNFATGDTRIMIFSQYRDSVHEITELLHRHRPLVKVMAFVGQTSAGKSSRGFTQKEQLKVMKDFREGGYNVLVSTCVGEEGLDIGDVDLIICFDASKSPIRLVQRMGRTGRKREGRIVMLVTQGKEEQIYNASQHSKRSIHKALTAGGRQALRLYTENPRMVPDGLTPACHRMNIVVGEKYVVGGGGKEKGRNSALTTKRHSSIGGKPNKKSSSTAGNTKKRKDGLLTDEELQYWNDNFKVESFQSDLYENDAIMHCLEKKKEINIQETAVSRWLPWQNCLQVGEKSGNGSGSRDLVSLMEFIDLQNAIGDDEDHYGAEMALYLHQEDLVLDGDTRRPQQPTLQQVVMSSNKVAHAKVIRRSRNLPEFSSDEAEKSSSDELPPAFATMSEKLGEKKSPTAPMKNVKAQKTPLRSPEVEKSPIRKLKTSRKPKKRSKSPRIIDSSMTGFIQPIVIVSDSEDFEMEDAPRRISADQACLSKLNPASLKQDVNEQTSPAQIKPDGSIQHRAGDHELHEREEQGQHCDMDFCAGDAMSDNRLDANDNAIEQDAEQAVVDIDCEEIAAKQDSKLSQLFPIFPMQKLFDMDFNTLKSQPMSTIEPQTNTTTALHQSVTASAFTTAIVTPRTGSCISQLDHSLVSCRPMPPPDQQETDRLLQDMAVRESLSPVDVLDLVDRWEHEKQERLGMIGAATNTSPIEFCDQSFRAKYGACREKMSVCKDPIKVSECMSTSLDKLCGKHDSCEGRSLKTSTNSEESPLDMKDSPAMKMSKARSVISSYTSTPVDGQKTRIRELEFPVTPFVDEKNLQGGRRRNPQSRMSVDNSDSVFQDDMTSVRKLSQKRLFSDTKSSKSSNLNDKSDSPPSIAPLVCDRISPKCPASDRMTSPLQGAGILSNVQNTGNLLKNESSDCANQDFPTNVGVTECDLKQKTRNDFTNGVACTSPVEPVDGTSASTSRLNVGTTGSMRTPATGSRSLEASMFTFTQALNHVDSTHKSVCSRRNSSIGNSPELRMNEKGQNEDEISHPNKNSKGALDCHNNISKSASFEENEHIPKYENEANSEEDSPVFSSNICSKFSQYKDNLAKDARKCHEADVINSHTVANSSSEVRTSVTNIGSGMLRELDGTFELPPSEGFRTSAKVSSQRLGSQTIRDFDETFDIASIQSSNIDSCTFAKNVTDEKCKNDLDGKRKNDVDGEQLTSIHVDRDELEAREDSDSFEIPMTQNLKVNRNAKERSNMQENQCEDVENLHMQNLPNKPHVEEPDFDLEFDLGDFDDDDFLIPPSPPAASSAQQPITVQQTKLAHTSTVAMGRVDDGITSSSQSPGLIGGLFGKSQQEAATGTDASRVETLPPAGDAVVCSLEAHFRQADNVEPSRQEAAGSRGNKPYHSRHLDSDGKEACKSLKRAQGMEEDEESQSLLARPATKSRFDALNSKWKQKLTVKPGSNKAPKTDGRGGKSEDLLEQELEQLQSTRKRNDSVFDGIRRPPTGPQRCTTPVAVVLPTLTQETSDQANVQYDQGLMPVQKYVTPSSENRQHLEELGDKDEVGRFAVTEQCSAYRNYKKNDQKEDEPNFDLGDFDDFGDLEETVLEGEEVNLEGLNSNKRPDGLERCLNSSCNSIKQKSTENRVPNVSHKTAQKEFKGGRSKKTGDGLIDNRENSKISCRFGVKTSIGISSNLAQETKTSGNHMEKSPKPDDVWDVPFDDFNSDDESLIKPKQKSSIGILPECSKSRPMLQISNMTDDSSDEDSFIQVTKKRRGRRAVILSQESPTSMSQQQRSDAAAVSDRKTGSEFKTPPVPRDWRKRRAIHSDDEASPVRPPKKKASIAAVIINSEDDDDDFVVDVSFRKPVTKAESRTGRQKTKKSHSAKHFLDEEAERSEDDVDQSDDGSEETGSDSYEASFVCDATQFSQGVSNDDMRAVYLRSVRSPETAAAGNNHPFRLRRDHLDIDVFSQTVRADDDSEFAAEYEEDSFCVRDDDPDLEEESPGEVTVLHGEPSLLDMPRTRYARKKAALVQESKMARGCRSKPAITTVAGRRRIKRLCDDDDDSDDDNDSRVRRKSSTTSSDESWENKPFSSYLKTAKAAAAKKRGTKSPDDITMKETACQVRSHPTSANLHVGPTDDSPSFTLGTLDSPLSSDFSQLPSLQSRVMSRLSVKVGKVDRDHAKSLNTTKKSLTEGYSNQQDGGSNIKSCKVTKNDQNLAVPEKPVQGKESKFGSQKGATNCSIVCKVPTSYGSKPSDSRDVGGCKITSFPSPAASSPIQPDLTLLPDDGDVSITLDPVQPGGLTVLIDSREISAAPEMVSQLRFTHGLKCAVRQLMSGCDVIVSDRMAVERKVMSDFTNGSNKQKLIDRMRHICELFDRPILIVENDRVKPGEKEPKVQLIKSRYVEQVLASLSQTHVRVFYSDGQAQSASIIADLVRLEQRKQHAIQAGAVELTPAQQSMLSFYQSLPRISYVTALNLLHGYRSITHFLVSDAATIATRGKMDVTRAHQIHKYLRHEFDAQMLG